MYNRRSLETNGYVNFPVKKFPSTHEGGMFVRLVVVDKDFLDDDCRDTWMVCSGGRQTIVYDEVYITDDKPYIGNKNSTNSNADEIELSARESFHFPSLFNSEDLSSYESIPYLCVMTIGSTGWSNTDWHCTYEDLTNKGKELYRQIQELYDGCELILQTWLDT